MSEEIRVGDRFLVEVEVVTIDPESEPKVLCQIGTDIPRRWFRSGILLASKRLPRALEVGDRVALPNFSDDTSARIIGLHEDCGVMMAWVKLGFGFGSYPVSDLTLAEESAS